MSKERREARVERYQELANKAAQESDCRYDTATDISQRFAGGQPILVGHHSEASARRDQERIHHNMRASIELQDKAAYYTEKAEAAANNTAIYTDDPDAIEKLRAKLECLEQKRTKIKEGNKDKRKLGQPPASSYILSNLGANIRTVRQRLGRLEKEAANKAENPGPVQNRFEDLHCTYFENSKEMRIQFLFDEKPPEAVRDVLKSHGFRWTPTFEGKPWQRLLNVNGRYAAKQVIQALRKSRIESEEQNEF